MDQPKVINQVSPEIEREAEKRARNRARAARWDIDVAIFFFVILIIVIILLYQGIGTGIVAPVAACGLAMGWLLGWKKAKRVYEIFYDEELSKLVQETKGLLQHAPDETIEEKIQKALRSRMQ